MVAGLVLAAGNGRRLGCPKALLRHQGTLLVEQAVGAVRDAGCAPVIVVLGAAADQVQASADLGPATVLVNKAWGTGVGSSLKTGLAAAAQTAAEAVLVVPVDMPGLTAAAVAQVTKAVDVPRDALACGTFGGRRSHPMLLGRAHWPGITSLAAADVDARGYLLARSAQVTEVACDELAEPDDLDTPDDAAKWGIDLPKPDEVPGPVA